MVNVTGLKSEHVWAMLTGSKKGDNVTEAAIIEVLDLILGNKTAEGAFNTVMLMNNAASMYKNMHGEYAVNTNPDTRALYSVISNDTWATALNMNNKAQGAVHLIGEAVMQPNIAGIPISSASVATEREIEVSESMVIVQSQNTKKYWTDNAVPRLKEWTITGYLTSSSPLDSGCLIKPSLQWQAYYLDVCATSRRPVLFKTNRGEFVKVQITNLHTDEEAHYNNAIGVTISLKEYNPYYIEDRMGASMVAIYAGAGAITL